MCMFSKQGPAQDALVKAVDRENPGNKHFPLYNGPSRPETLQSQITEGSVSPTSMAGMQANLNRRANRGSGTYQNIRT